ncbi:SIR2 family protein [Lentzea aerocolonigenes]|uniref:SIR2 family protein n=1 Tax=Lentzea aerocolonigenes TaxID=68170 RepID=UPI0004C3D817|nr:SIR2 family protein [Lentzea aerocolonigenes]MCP2242705.1 SIR2-like domain-containing protein [Lentzea aerocolonigenes]
MSFARSADPFFSDSDTYTLIEHIANQRSLVIYAGAGVTIDRTGQSWPALVEKLLRKHKDSDEVCRAIMATNTPLQAGSIVSQLYLNRSDGWRTELGNDIRGCLYEGRAWRQGSLATAAVRLAAALADHGREYCVVTTNYDDFIEQEVRVLAEDRARRGLPPIELRTSVVEPQDAHPDFEIVDHVEPGQILHLHGYVPNRTGEATDVVLSEKDYMASQARTSAVLEYLFRRHSVIIVGSSLTDAPLLSALAKTVPGDNEQRLRVAVTPLQSLQFPPDSDAFIGDVKESVTDRMASFGVRAVFPDFFYQTAQFLAEARISLDRRDPDAVGLPASAVARYRTRLHSWWKAWSEERGGTELERQLTDHQKLCEAMARIRQMLSIPQAETVKLEIWVRWDPRKPSGLRLWASTTNLWQHTEVMRCADIVANSAYTSVQAFCSGQPGIYPSDSDRWKTYLCVPTRVDSVDGDLPIAVISLASMRDGKTSRISEKNGALLRRVIVEVMKPVAEAITGG